MSHGVVIICPPFPEEREKKPTCTEGLLFSDDMFLVQELKETENKTLRETIKFLQEAFRTLGS